MKRNINKNQQKFDKKYLIFSKVGLQFGPSEYEAGGVHTLYFL